MYRLHVNIAVIIFSFDMYWGSLFAKTRQLGVKSFTVIIASMTF